MPRDDIAPSPTETRAGDDGEIARRILAVAHYMTGADPEEAARRRAWMDAAGRPTGDGRALVRALSEQSDTRTILRGV